jgi:hypothetical protein
MYMANIISDTSSFEDLVRIVNSLTLKINQLEKKINILEESNSLISGYNMSNEIIVDKHVFRSVPYVIPDEAPPVTRQNAFPSFPMNC